MGDDVDALDVLGLEDDPEIVYLVSFPETVTEEEARLAHTAINETLQESAAVVLGGTELRTADESLTVGQLHKEDLVTAYEQVADAEDNGLEPPEGVPGQ